jgi:hypothetical protein
VFLLSHRSQDRHAVTDCDNRRQTVRQGYSNSVRFGGACSACMKPAGRSSHWRGQAASVKSWSTPEAWVTASMMLEPMPGVSSPTSAGSGRPMVYAGVEPRSDGSVRWEGRLLLARASAENRCDTLHPKRPPQSAVARRRGRRQVDADSARIGQAAAQGWRVLLVNRHRGGGASVIERGELSSAARATVPSAPPTKIAPVRGGRDRA